MQGMETVYEMAKGGKEHERRCLARGERHKIKATYQIRIEGSFVCRLRKVNNHRVHCQHGAHWSRMLVVEEGYVYRLHEEQKYSLR